ARLAGPGNDQIADDAAVTLNFGTLDLNGHSESIRSLSGAGGIITTFSGAANLTILDVGGANPVFAGQIQQFNSPISLTKAGPGTLTLTGNNTFSGPLTVTTGILNLSNIQFVGPIVISNNATAN